MLQRTLPAGFIAPCLPTKTTQLPSGDLWLHEIKHDGFRIIARKKAAQVRLYSRPGNDLSEHIEGDGPTVFAHACKMGLEGIVSKRKDSPYRSGRSPDWVKMKNPDSPAVKREAEEDWTR
jgi:bifunctional non-homologous end joining protein LigD